MSFYVLPPNLLNNIYPLNTIAGIISGPKVGRFLLNSVGWQTVTGPLLVLFWPSGFLLYVEHSSFVRSNPLTFKVCSDPTGFFFILRDSNQKAIPKIPCLIFFLYQLKSERLRELFLNPNTQNDTIYIMLSILSYICYSMHYKTLFYSKFLCLHSSWGWFC